MDNKQQIESSTPREAYQEQAKLIVEKIKNAGGVGKTWTEFDLITSVSISELQGLARDGKVANKALSYETLISSNNQYAIAANISEKTRNTNSPVSEALGLNHKEQKHIIDWSKQVKPQIAKKLQTFRQELSKSIEESVREELREEVIKNEKMRLGWKLDPLKDRLQNLEMLVKTNKDATPFELFKRQDDVLDKLMEKKEKTAISTVQSNAIKVIREMRKGNLSHYQIDEFSDHILDSAERVVSNWKSVEGVQWSGELEAELEKEVVVVKQEAKLVKSGRSRLDKIIVGVKDKYLDTVTKPKEDMVRNEILEKVQESNLEEHNPVLSDFLQETKEIKSLIDKTVEETIGSIEGIREWKSELDEVKKKVKTLSQGVSEEIILEKIEANFDRKLNKIVDAVIGRTAAKHWSSNQAPLYPRLMYIRNRTPPEIMMTRGFGGQTSTDSVRGDINLFFPPDNGEFENIELVDLKAKEGRNVVETYEIREKKPDGSSEDYLVSITDEGVKITCQSGQVSEIKFGEPQPFISLLRKPVIYMYSKHPLLAEVNLDYKGDIIFEYPMRVDSTWKVNVLGDGDVEVDNKKYPYLFWEGKPKTPFDIDQTEGFVIAPNEFSIFFEEKLKILGLSDREITDFITYWGGMFVNSRYIFVKFDAKKYEAVAKLKITPNPDLLIRIFVIFKRLNEKIEVKTQNLKIVKEGLRNKSGFTVVEWGGTEIQ